MYDSDKKKFLKVVSTGLVLPFLTVPVGADDETKLAVDVKTHHIQSKILQQKRTVHQYQAHSVKVPQHVVVAADGKNYDKSYRRVLAAMASNPKCQSVTILAVENPNRGDDFTPPYEKYGKPGHKKQGHADRYLDFLKKEILQVQAKPWKVGEKLSYYAMGHSWGGAFVAYALSEHKETVAKEADLPQFKGYFMFSPTVIYRQTAEQSAAQMIANFNKNMSAVTVKPDFVVMTAGGAEPEKFRAPYPVLKQAYTHVLKDQSDLHFQLHDKVGHFETLDHSIDHAFNQAFCSSE